MTIRRPRQSRPGSPRRRAAFLSAVDPLEARRLLTTYTVAAFADAAAVNPASGDARSTRGDGAITLRSAIQAADATAGPNTIILPAGTYTLNISAAPGGADGPESGDLNITNSLTITGAGAATTIISIPFDSINDRVLSVSGPGTSTISGVTITGGDRRDPGGPSQGGGIYVAPSANLNLTDSVVTDNKSTSFNSTSALGAGIYNAGQLTLNRTTVSSNAASSGYGGARGGGIVNDNGGKLTLINSVVSNNRASETGAGNGSFGGGIYNFGGQLTLTNSTVRDNNAGADYGGSTSLAGGIYTLGALSLTDSTVSGNKAGNGGGIISVTGAFLLSESTVSGNTASSGDGGGILFGVTEAPAPNGSIDGSTIAGNTAIAGGAGGIFSNSSGAVTIKNTILAANTGGNFVQQSGVAIGLKSLGHNLSTDATTATVFTAPGDLNNVADAKLGPLANNGGPTFTQALLTGSPAIDAGDPLGAPATDQRGLTRIVNGKIDIGAFEVQAAAAPVLSVTGSAPASVTIGRDITYILNVRNTGPAGATGVVLTDTLPPGVTFRSATLGQTPVQAAVAGRVVTFNFGPLTGGSTDTVNLLATPSSAATVTNSVTVQSNETGATNPPATQTTVVNQGATQTNLTSSPNPSAFGHPVTFTADVVPTDLIIAASVHARAHAVHARQVVLPPGLPPFAGSVTFRDGPTVLDTVPVRPDGSAVFTTSSLAPGRHTITATFGRDPNYSPSTSPPVFQVVTGVADGPRVVSVRRYGYHRTPTTLVVTFDTPLDRGSAETASNYRISDARGVAIPVVSAFYDAASHTVSLSPSTFLDLHRRYTLTINGSTPGGVKGVTGSLLDGTVTGQAESDYVTVVDAANLVVTSPFADGATAALRYAARVRAADARAAHRRP